MGLAVLGFLWFAGIALAVAIAMRMSSRKGTAIGLGLGVLCLLVLESMHFAAGLACAPGGCEPLAPVLGWIRSTLAGLTIGGMALGLVLGWMVRRHAAPDAAG